MTGIPIDMNTGRKMTDLSNKTAPPIVLVESSDFNEAWYKILCNILLYGKQVPKDTESDVDTLDSAVSVSIYGKGVLQMYMGTLHSQAPMKDRNALQNYVNQFIPGTDEYETAALEQPYTYGSRLKEQVDEHMQQDNVRPFNRKVLMSTWDERSDTGADNPPCLISLQIRELAMKTCEVHTYWRSHDAFGAWQWNMVAIVNMVNKLVCEPLGLTMVKLTDFSASMHIYDYDWSKAAGIQKPARVLTEGDS